MNKLQRTIVVLTDRPTDFQAEGFASQVAIDRYESVSFSFGVVNELPADLDVAAADQLAAKKRDAGPNAVYLIVHNKE
jgi:hypothetical protein